jgi:hypothetical protein
MDWITVVEGKKESQASPQVINIGSIDSSTKISDSVLTRSNVGRSSNGKRGGSISVSDSVVTGSNIGGGSDDGVEWADTRKQNCPNCSASIKPGWKACPNCGTMF